MVTSEETEMVSKAGATAIVVDGLLGAHLFLLASGSGSLCASLSLTST